LSILLEPSNIIEHFKKAHVIVIDETSMMTINMLCVIEQQLKQSMNLENIFQFKTNLLLLVGNLAQLSPICKHKSQNATIATKVVIYIKESFTPNFIYVMLSKVTNRNNLKIIENLIPMILLLTIS